ncbi:MAG: hypothetical protein JW838_00810 [Spirochaetes bacterium]|nr:hypothetical protein [Spirochaetota bacterium]
MYNHDRRNLWDAVGITSEEQARFDRELVSVISGLPRASMAVQVLENRMRHNGDSLRNFATLIVAMYASSSKIEEERRSLKKVLLAMCAVLAVIGVMVISSFLHARGIL